jgi:hypothetical protein
MMSFSLGDYVTVNERLKAALEKFPELRVIERPPRIVEAGGKTFVEVQMTVYRDASDTVPMLGHAWEEFPGTTPYTRGSEAANAATSCLGRILGYMGFGINKSIATQDDVKHREQQHTPQQSPRATFVKQVPTIVPTVYATGEPVPDPFTGEQQTSATYPPGDVTKGQMGKMRALARERNIMSNKDLFAAIGAIIGRNIHTLDVMSKREASQVIESWLPPVIQDEAGEIPTPFDEEPF